MKSRIAIRRCDMIAINRYNTPGSNVAISIPVRTPQIFSSRYAYLLASIARNDASDSAIPNQTPGTPDWMK